MPHYIVVHYKWFSCYNIQFEAALCRLCHLCLLLYIELLSQSLGTLSTCFALPMISCGHAMQSLLNKLMPVSFLIIVIVVTRLHIFVLV